MEFDVRVQTFVRDIDIAHRPIVDQKILVQGAALNIPFCELSNFYGP